jgi:hypothetical protein
MMAGSQKLMASPVVKARKSGDKALRFECLKISDISVRSSWAATAIGEVIKKVSSKQGSSPEYIISDNAGTITKAVRYQSSVHIPAPGHTLSLFVERVYKNDAGFKSFYRDITKVKFREIMRPAAYLLPPKQQSIARFMNLSSTVERAHKMLQSIPRLTEKEQQVFSFLRKHAGIINELETLSNQLDKISERLK